MTCVGVLLCLCCGRVYVEECKISMLCGGYVL